MTVRRGEDWGQPGPLAPWAPVATDDASAAAALADQRTSPHADAVPEVGLLGGDLHRTVGAPVRSREGLAAGEGVRLTVDLLEVELVAPDGTTTRRTGLAHLVGRRRALFAGRTVLAMNAAFVGPANLAPRAHPGDGRLDVLEGALPWRDRRRARVRARTGTHVPHPLLRERRAVELEVLDAADLMWFLDGQALPACRTVRVRVLPDAAVVVV